MCGDSSITHFARTLGDAAVRVCRSAASRDCFDHAEALVRNIVTRHVDTVCFWNVDAKVKLLLCKALGALPVRLIDVSPGAYAFEEMAATHAFQEWIAYSAEEYYARLDTLVLKYPGTAPEQVRKVRVIPNGVSLQKLPIAAGALLRAKTEAVLAM